MTDQVDAGAEAPVQESSAPIDPPVSAPQELGSQVPPIEKDAPKPEEKPSKSAREAIERASKKVKLQEQEKDAAKSAQKGDEDGEAKARKPDAQPDKGTKDAKGKLQGDGKADSAPDDARNDGSHGDTAKDGEKPTRPAPLSEEAPFREPPSRFKGDPGASESWNETPEAVRGAVHRTIKEMEQGIEKYRADSEAFDSVRDFSDLAKEQGTNLRQALENYVSAEKLLYQDPIAGLDAIAQRMGYSLRDIAAHVLNQSPDQVQSQRDAENRALKQQIEQLTQQVSQLSTGFSEQQNQQVQSTIEKFAAQTDASGSPLHPRMAELESDMVFLLEAGRAGDLQEAYDLADRLNPSPFANAAHTRTTTQDAAHTPSVEPARPKAAGKSIAGAPSNGFEPEDKGPAPSIGESLRRARSQVRVG